MTTALIEVTGAIAVITLFFAVVVLAMIHIGIWMERQYENDAVAEMTFLATTEISDRVADETERIDQRLRELAREREESVL